jgi:tetratricopeptide (TPR) repeat protein
MKIAQAGLGWSLALLVLGSGACGGSEPPAQTGGSPASGASGDNPAASLPASPPPPSAEASAGVRAFDAGNYADARKAFEAATKKNPNDYESLQNLGLACEKLGDLPAAETAYKAALAVKPDLETAATALSALYIDAGRNDEAEAVARAGLVKHPTSAVLHENLAVAIAAKGDQDGASKEFAQAIQLTPTDPMFHLTFAHWLNTWKVRGAAPHLDAARDLAKDDYALIVSIGFEYRMAGEYDSCVKILDHAVSMKDGGEVRTHRALCRLGLKDEKGTLADLQAAVEKEPTYAPAHYYLAGRLATGKHYRDAAAEYAKYLDLAPNGSLAKPASDRLRAAQDAMAKKK